MKILFLDIDGVVNCKTTVQRHGGFIGIDPLMAFLVGKIHLDTGCKIVLSSSWRHFKDGREEVSRRVYPVFDTTPTHDDGHRGREIQEWLSKAKEPVEKYAILDDDTDMLPEQLPNFFKTSWETGITEEIAKKVTEHLNAK